MLLMLVFLGFIGIEHAFLAFCLALAISLCFVRPAIAVSTLAGYLIARPWELMPSNAFMQALPRTLAGISFLVWLIFLVRNNNRQIAWNSVMVLTLGLVIWFLASAFLVGDDGSSMTYVGESFVPIIFLITLLPNSIEDKLDLSLFISFLVISIAGVVTSSIFLTLYEQGALAVKVRLYGFGLMANANDLGALIALGLPFIVFGFVVHGQRYASRIFGVLLVPVFLTGLWLTQSRGTILSLVASGLVYLLFCGKSAKKIFFAAALLLIVPAAVLVGLQRDPTEVQDSQSSRWNYVETAFRMVKESPVFGVGPGNYPKLYNSYTLNWFEEGHRTAHSTWVLAFAEGGIVGLLILVGIFTAALRAAWKIRLTSPEILLALIAYCVAMSFLSHTYIFIPYMVFALASTAAAVNSSRSLNPAKDR